jgi:hypothetical protein
MGGREKVGYMALAESVAERILSSESCGMDVERNLAKDRSCNASGEKALQESELWRRRESNTLSEDSAKLTQYEHERDANATNSSARTDLEVSSPHPPKHHSDIKPPSEVHKQTPICAISVQQNSEDFGRSISTLESWARLSLENANEH